MRRTTLRLSVYWLFIIFAFAVLPLPRLSHAQDPWIKFWVSTTGPDGGPFNPGAYVTSGWSHPYSTTKSGTTIAQSLTY
ncbi:MAG: hypothetical protein J5J00_02040, partial [Deltaproteobacteria bacterium]|nr:hypothetical protein [Deltaproteobacteria bacterium]